MSEVENTSRKGIPEGTPSGAHIGGPNGHCDLGIGGCVYPKSCKAERHCIALYRTQMSEGEADSEVK